MRYKNPQALYDLRGQLVGWFYAEHRLVTTPAGNPSQPEVFPNKYVAGLPIEKQKHRNKRHMIRMNALRRLEDELSN